MKSYKDINLICMDFDGVVAADVRGYGETALTFSGKDYVGIDFVKTILKIPFIVISHCVYANIWCNKMKIPNIWVALGNGKEVFLDDFFSDDAKNRLHEIRRRYRIIQYNEQLDDIIIDKNSYETTCFIGDDITDLSLLEKVGFPVVPADAHEWLMDKIFRDTNSPIYEKATILEHEGGAGAVREVCDYILMAHGIDEPMTAYRKALENNNG